jgi:hypothetical protein
VAVGIARGVGGAAARQTKTQYQWPLTHPSWVNNKGRWYERFALVADIQKMPGGTS